MRQSSTVRRPVPRIGFVVALGWVLGLVFHVAALLIKVALATAVIAFVWRTVAGRRTPKSSM